MNRWLSSTLLTAAALSVPLPACSLAQHNDPQAIQQSSATESMADAIKVSPLLTPQAIQQSSATESVQAPATANIPIRTISLYSSGVGYFEHAGTITGDATATLRFKANQISDILKSLVVQDQGGAVSLVSYPSQDPLSKQLSSFSINLSANPSLANLLNQLRGQRLSVTTATNGAIHGTIIGVESRAQVTPGQGGTVITDSILNLLVEGNIQPVNLSEVRALSLDDPRLQKEFLAALNVLANANDQDKKPVTIAFHGQGERPIRIGYVIESPVWKTSYRLLLSDDQAKPAQIQGWAIVENQTDTDWQNVQLSLISGRPISFAMDLYQPIYLHRPVVQPELYQSLRPQQYGQALNTPAPLAAASAPVPSATSRVSKSGVGEDAAFRQAGDRNVEGRLETSAANELRSNLGFSYDGPLDASASVQAAASGASIGELFQYTLDTPITLARQSSAMIPIVTGDIEAQQLSIYNPSTLPRNPLNGVRIINTTGKHLLTGPLTVLLNGTYAGDATIGSIPPSQDRLISYGIDQQLLIDKQNQPAAETLQTARIVKGVLEATNQSIITTRYTIANKGERDKTLLIEQPILNGWDLVEPEKPAEKTDTLYRFELLAQTGKTFEFLVKQRRINRQSLALLNVDEPQLSVFSRNSALPAPVRDALIQVIQLRQALATTQRDMQQTQATLTATQQDQDRVRRNINSVSRDSSFYAQQMKKMVELEDKIDTLQQQHEKLLERSNTQRTELEQYLAGLNVS